MASVFGLRIGCTIVIPALPLMHSLVTVFTDRNEVVQVLIADALIRQVMHLLSSIAAALAFEIVSREDALAQRLPIGARQVFVVPIPPPVGLLRSEAGEMDAVKVPLSCREPLRDGVVVAHGVTIVFVEISPTIAISDP
jgi:hypothetical protein